MSLKPVIAGSFVQVPAAGGSSSSTPGLPVWTYTAGAMAEGLMKPNNADPSATGNIEFSFTSKNGAGVSLSNFFIGIPANSNGKSKLILTGPTGKSYEYIVDSISLNASSATLVVVTNCVDSGPWSGDYQLSFCPGQGVSSVNTNQGDVTVDVTSVLVASSIIPVADGTYTVGLGGSQDGTISIVSGIITAVQQAQA